jgi:hypothetical protein
MNLLLLSIALSSTPAMAQDGEFSIRSVHPFIFYLATLLITVLSVRIGFGIGKRRHSLFETKTDPTVPPVSGALMGLLAFILAFTFNMSMNRYDSRKMLYIDQVNAIEVLYRKAELIPDMYRTVMQAELIKYMDLRIEVIAHSDKIKSMVRQSDEIQKTLWKLIDDMDRDDQIRDAMIVTLVNSMTTLTEIHNKRTTVALIYHLVTPMWVALFALVIIAMMGMGYLLGMTPKINWILVLILSMAFSSVIMMISELDRSGSNSSIIGFNQQAMIDLKARLTEPDP